MNKPMRYRYWFRYRVVPLGVMAALLLLAGALLGEPVKQVFVGTAIGALLSIFFVKIGRAHV